MTTKTIRVTHLGEDYATIEIGGQEFETSLGLGTRLLELQQEEALELFHRAIQDAVDCYKLLEAHVDPLDGDGVDAFTERVRGIANDYQGNT